MLLLLIVVFPLLTIHFRLSQNAAIVKRAKIIQASEPCIYEGCIAEVLLYSCFSQVPAFVKKIRPTLFRQA